MTNGTKTTFFMTNEVLLCLSLELVDRFGMVKLNRFTLFRPYP